MSISRPSSSYSKSQAYPTGNVASTSSSSSSSSSAIFQSGGEESKTEENSEIVHKTSGTSEGLEMKEFQIFEATVKDKFGNEVVVNFDPDDCSYDKTNPKHIKQGKGKDNPGYNFLICIPSERKIFFYYQTSQHPTLQDVHESFNCDVTFLELIDNYDFYFVTVSLEEDYIELKTLSEGNKKIPLASIYDSNNGVDLVSLANSYIQHEALEQDTSNANIFNFSFLHNEKFMSGLHKDLSKKVVAALCDYWNSSIKKMQEKYQKTYYIKNPYHFKTLPSKPLIDITDYKVFKKGKLWLPPLNNTLKK